MAAGSGGTETTLNTYSCVECIRKYSKGSDSEMVHLEKALTTKPDDLSSVPRTLEVGGKNTVHTHAHRHTINKYTLDKLKDPNVV